MDILKNLVANTKKIVTQVIMTLLVFYVKVISIEMPIEARRFSPRETGDVRQPVNVDNKSASLINRYR
jgi:hypothetical protein